MSLLLTLSIEKKEKMNAQEIQSKLLVGLAQDTKHEHRDYVGMSGIGGCPREMYWRYMDPQPAEQRLLWYSWTGYMHEEAVLKLLGAEQVRRDIVASFDDRYRGHTDHELPDGTLVEVKSVGWNKIVRLRGQRKASENNIAQVQAYMKHGGFEKGVIVYVARDIPHREFYKWKGDWLPPFWCVEVFPDTFVQDELDKKAKMVLTMIDRGVPPRCECRWCRR